ncbi:MAG: hypothetical protein ACO1N0_15040 [Fluviicola sp.]
MKEQTLFPVLHNVSGAFSTPDSTVLLDGMKVVFDKKVSATPVDIDYKTSSKSSENNGKNI